MLPFSTPWSISYDLAKFLNGPESFNSTDTFLHKVSESKTITDKLFFTTMMTKHYLTTFKTTPIKFF